MSRNNKNNKKNSSRRGGSRKHNKGSSGSRLGDVGLPHINNKPRQTRCFRYSNAGLTTQKIFTTLDLQHMMGTTISGSNAYYPLIESIELKRVGLNAVASGTGGLAGVVFSWEGPNVPDIADTSYVSVGVPLSKSYYPPTNTGAKWWWKDPSVSTDVFGLSGFSADSGDCNIILDIEVVYILASGTVSPYTLPGTTGISGISYAQLPLADNSFIPVGLTSRST